MRKHLRDLLLHRTLLWLWTLREIRIRYKQSLLGAAWAILQPLSMMIVLTAVFSRLARVQTEGIPYPLFALTALILWTFLANSLAGAVTSLTNNMNLVQKIYFPREILPAGVVLAAFLDLLVASLILVPFFIYYTIPLSASLAWVPVILVLEATLCLGLALPLAAVCVRFRDARFVVPLLLQLWLFASPVIYPTSLIPERFRWLYTLNPMAGLIESFRAVSIQGEAPEFAILAYTALVAIALLGGGYAFFKRSEPDFADII